MPENQANIFVIVPCFNEHPTIRSTLSALLGASYQVVLVDDGSTPAIYPLIKDLSLHYLRHSHNLGQGASLRTGMEYALEKGAQIIVHFDADGQHQVSDIESLIAPIRKKYMEVALGSRFLEAHHISEIPWARRNLLRIARMFNGLYTGLWLSDAHNGLRAFSREAAETIQITKDRMAHATEILTCIHKNKLAYCEVPTHILYPQYARKKGQRSWDSVHILYELLAR